MVGGMTIGDLRKNARTELYLMIDAMMSFFPALGNSVLLIGR